MLLRHEQRLTKPLIRRWGAWFFLFAFEKLIVYRKAKAFHSEIRAFIKASTLDRITKDQLIRASLSIALALAEGSGRFCKEDRRHFFVIARKSFFEVVAILYIFKDENEMDQMVFEKYDLKSEEISRITFRMIKNLS